jgi:hypothetical protein
VSRSSTVVIGYTAGLSIADSKHCTSYIPHGKVVHGIEWRDTERESM